MKNYDHVQSYQMAGLFTLSIRLVIGWTYFSAFWRRLILENKLIPEEAGYIGEKFNHFLPNAIGIKPVIEYLVTHPEELQMAMVVFTIVEAIVGLFIMLGFFTRLMSIGVFFLAMGILLGSGWIGTTCLDEWQIGVLGIAAGFTLFLSGSGSYSLDHYLIVGKFRIAKTKIFKWFGSGQLPVVQLQRFVGLGSVLILALTLYTNQYFHGGVWGKLRNKSVKPKIEILYPQIKEGQLSFQLYRTEGADVYGSFLIGIALADKNGNAIFQLDNQDLAKFLPSDIRNHYVARVKPGKHSLEIPLGARADLEIRHDALGHLTDQQYRLVLTDISGLTWQTDVVVD